MYSLKVSSVMLMLVASGLISCYPDHVPISACKSMFPDGHSATARSSQPPFTIQLSHASYTPGEKVNLTLKSQAGSYFEGVFIQARRQCAQGGNEAIGAFVDYDAGMKTMRCNVGQHDALLHSTKEKKYTKTFSWIAPAKATGPVYFKATFVQETTMFWTDVTSVVLADTTNNCPEPPAELNSTVSSMTTAVLTDGQVNPRSTLKSNGDRGPLYGKKVFGMDVTLFAIILVVVVVGVGELIIGIVHLTNYCRRNKKSPPLKDTDVPPHV